MAPFRKPGRPGYFIRFQLDGAVHRPAAFTTIAASDKLERNVKALIALRAGGEEPDHRLRAYLGNLPQSKQVYLRNLGLLDAGALGPGSLAKLRATYVQLKRDEGRKTADLIETHLTRLLDGIKAKTPAEITATKVQAWLASQLRADGTDGKRFGHATANHYRKDARAFCRWLMRQDHLVANPLDDVPRFNVAVDPRHRRASLSAKDLTRLLRQTRRGPTRYGMTGRERALLYRLTAETGFRAGQIRPLTASAFHLGASIPTVTAEAITSKTGRELTNPLTPATARLIGAAIKKRPKGAPLFALPSRYNMADMFRADLDDADIPTVDARGRVLDFHALRRTAATLLRAAGTHPKIAQGLLGHSTIALTMDVYTDSDLEDAAEAVRAVGRLLGRVGRPEPS